MTECFICILLLFFTSGFCGFGWCFGGGFLNRYFVYASMTSFLTVMGFDILEFVSSVAKPVAVVMVVGMILWMNYGDADKGRGGFK